MPKKVTAYIASDDHLCATLDELKLHEFGLIMPKLDKDETVVISPYRDAVFCAVKEYLPHLCEVFAMKERKTRSKGGRPKGAKNKPKAETAASSEAPPPA